MLKELLNEISCGNELNVISVALNEEKNKVHKS